MRLKSGIAMAAVIVFATSCGESSTKTDTADSTVVAENVVVDPAPVNTTVVVPDTLKTTFKTKYPTVSNENWSRYEPIETFDWELAGWPAMDTADYVVRFNQDNADYWAWYDENNNWVGTVSPVTDYAGLPSAVNKTVQGEFAGYTIASVNKENDKNRTAYEIQLTKGDDKVKALIGENGKVIKKKANIGGEKTKEKMNPKDSI